MNAGSEIDRWRQARQHLTQQWPALMRSLPERIEIVMQGGAIGLSDGSVVVRADWIARSNREALNRAMLHLAAHAALGHRPWRQHVSVADGSLDQAAQHLLRALGVAMQDIAWSEDHHGTWSGVPIRAPGEAWVARPKTTLSDDAASALTTPSPTDIDPAVITDEPKSSAAEQDASRMSDAAGDRPAHRSADSAADRTRRRGRQSDWRALLRLWLVQRSYLRWQFDRPARRRVEPFVLPRLAGRQLRLAVALDISGSIDPRWFEQFFREIEVLRGLLPVQLRLFTCDNRIHLDRPMQGAVTVPPFTGGGGTDFRPVFARLAGDAGLDALIYCTDLMGDYPASPPHFPVFWLVPAEIRAAPSRQPDPPFGHVLTMGGGVGA